MKRFATFIFILLILAFSAFAQKLPSVSELKQISQLPAEIPQRVEALAYDGEKLWFAIYLDNGRYATFNLQTKEWTYSNSEIQHQSISQVIQPFNSASGMVFVGKTLWLSGSYGESFGSINTENWKVEKLFKQKVRPDLRNSQAYADMTFDGENLWIAWHLFDYTLPDSEVQQLLKVNTVSGEILEKYPLPVGTRNDGTHGLSFDGTKLWHIKDKKLSAIDLDGRLTAQFELKELERPSGLAWDGNSLWIVGFNGKLWNLPFKTL